MEVTTPRAPKRQETLGPTSPIQDWEVERATVMVELTESREKADRLEKQLEIDRQTYEKNTSSLLREVKLKESFMDKKLKDVEEQLMSQLVELQRTLDAERVSRQEEIQRLKSEQQEVMEAEDKKYQRRLVSLQERLTAKDKEYTEIIERHQSQEQYSGEDKEVLIESLQVELAKEKEKNSKLQESDDEQGSGNQELFKELKEKLEASESLIKEQQQNIEALKNDLAASNKQAQLHKKRLDQIESGHDAHIRELTEKFMSEIQQSQMSNHAQLQNLQSENADIIRELREQYETEKEVWQIQQSTSMDELRRELQAEKEEAIRQLNREWKEKSEDLEASMSKDAMEIQAHWEAKLTEAKSKYDSKTSRLQGEMEVVKDRLGKEIQRRKLNQALLSDATEKNDALETKLEKLKMDHANLLKKYIKLDNEAAKIKSEYRTCRHLALDIMMAISPDFNADAHSDLPDILQTARRQVSIMSIHTQMDYENQDSRFDMDGISSYGY